MANPEALVSGSNLFSRLWDNNMDKFQWQIWQRWGDLRQGVLSDMAIANCMDKYADLLMESGAWQREWHCWNSKDVDFEFDLYEEIEYMKDRYGRNADFLDKQILKIDRVKHLTTPVDIYTNDGMCISNGWGVA